MFNAGQGHLSPTAHLNVTDPTVADSATLLQLVRYLVGARHATLLSMYDAIALSRRPNTRAQPLGSIVAWLQQRLGLLLCSVPSLRSTGPY